MADSGIVIVGAGVAGVSAATALREYGGKGQITLIDGETSIPYDRPPLSKSTLTSSEDPVPAPLIQAARLDALQIRYLAGTRVESIDRSKRAVATSEHGDIFFNRLGACPRNSGNWWRCVRESDSACS
jgi:3-phenylpropionate/trans-cinnamate dioxygenase ferredoxin reductase component